MSGSEVRKSRRPSSNSPMRKSKATISTRREREAEEIDQSRSSEKENRRVSSARKEKRSSSADKDERRHSSVKEIRKSSSSDKDRKKSTIKDSKRHSSPDAKKHSSSNSSDSRRRSTRHRTSTKETRERGRSGRPRMCRDQMLSIRNLFADDDNDEDEKEKEKEKEKVEKHEKHEKKERKKTERDEEKERRKKEKKKKKARELKEQMNRRAMLNMQFTSIRRMLDGSEFLDDGPKLKQTPMDDDDHTVNFDPFAATPMFGTENAERPSLFTEGKKEISFRDLLADKTSRGLSFRDLMKTDADKGNDPRAFHQNQFHMSCIVDNEEDDGNENDDSADFENILWGDLNEVSEDDFAESAEGEDFAMNVDEFRVDNSTSGNDFDRSFSVSVSENTFSSNAGSVNSSGFPCPRSPTKKNRRVIEVVDEQISPRSVKSDQQHSVNTHNSSRSETDTPSQKKKKKALGDDGYPSGRSKEKHTTGSSKTASPLPIEGGKRMVKRTGSGKSDGSGGIPDTLVGFDTPGTTVKRGVSRTISPTVTNQTMDFDFDPQKASFGDMMALQHAIPGVPVRKNVKKTSSGDKLQGMPPLSPMKAKKSKKKSMVDGVIETNDHIFVE